MAVTAQATVVERAQKGDCDARDELLGAAARRLYPIAYRVVRDRDLADDAVQRTLVTIWRELPKLRDPAKFDAWSQRTLVRICSDELRRRSRHTGQPLEPELIGSADRASELGTRDLLERAFGHLSTDQRAVVVMVYWQGLTGVEVAARLGVSPGTVASRLHYALRALRAGIDADERAAGLLSATRPSPPAPLNAVLATR
jgi:RNA polymerase sigma-70 factor, ECF subfamily